MDGKIISKKNVIVDGDEYKRVFSSVLKKKNTNKNVRYKIHGSNIYSYSATSRLTVSPSFVGILLLSLNN